MAIEITADKRGLIVKTPYSRLFVEELKRLVPASDRQFESTSRAWIIAPAYSTTIQKLIMSVFKVSVHMSEVKAVTGKVERAEIRVEYLGQCKQRPDGTVSAYGHDGQSWAVIVPEAVLRAFFGQDVEISVEGEETRSRGKSAPSTLYAALLVESNSSPIEIKSAYRRMARLVHPDVNHEPDAAAQFKAVQHAYEVLSDPVKRRRYDAGLALEAGLGKPKSTYGGMSIPVGLFRAPLRCGRLVVDGEQKLGRLIVSRIHSWRDIVDEQGRVMVSSWPFDAESYQITWA
jgi:hypothetical protein